MAIQKLGGAVFPKLNWTAPKSCSDSEKIVNSLPVLVLRKWCDINPSGEFRCFVTQSRLMGVCPRDVSQYYPCLGLERSSILADISSFWRENIDNRFPLKNYVFDVVRKSKDEVLLLDFSPLHEGRTRGLLFDNRSTDELHADGDDAEDLHEAMPEFRYISSETGVQPSLE
ncbi:hypothetical protein HAZT_HAZT002788, partial [Hyalella azteca]